MDEVTGGTDTLGRRCETFLQLHGHLRRTQPSERGLVCYKLLVGQVRVIVNIS